MPARYYPPPPTEDSLRWHVAALLAKLLRPDAANPHVRLRALVISAIIVAAIFTSRVLIDTPNSPGLVFIFVPIMLIAVAFGPAGGALSAAIIVAAVTAIDIVKYGDVVSDALLRGDAATVVRLIGFVIAGTLAGVIADGARVLHDRAEIDPLTGLYNRLRLLRDMERHAAEVKRYGPHGAIALIDLDDFKDVNDTYGHHVGDELLRQIATRLRARARETDVVTRLGGDEFAVFMPRTNVGDAYAYGRSIVDVLSSEPYELHDAPVMTVCASVGVAPFTSTASPTETLIRADVNMYRAKHDGGNRVVVSTST